MTKCGLQTTAKSCLEFVFRYSIKPNLYLLQSAFKWTIPQIVI